MKIADCEPNLFQSQMASVADHLGRNPFMSSMANYFYRNLAGISCGEKTISNTPLSILRGYLANCRRDSRREMYGRQEMLDRFDEIDQELDSPQTPLQLIGRGAENEVYQARFRNERLAHKIVLGQYSVQIEGQLYPYSGVRPIHEQVRVVDKKILGQLSVKGDKSFAQMLGASYQKCQMVQELIGQPADSIAVLIGSDSHFLSKLPSSNQRQIAQVVKTAVAKGVASDIHLGNIVFDPETNRSVLVDFARRRRGCERIDLRIAKKGLPPEISQYL